MKITPDSNVLLRAVLLDDPDQGLQAANVLRGADLIALTLPTLCEFAWVLRRQRKVSRDLVAAKIRELLASSRVVADIPAIEAGLATLDAGGDFADGVIAFEGRRLGGEIFMTFDREAAELLSASGAAVALL